MRDTIELAREAGFTEGELAFMGDNFRRFADLVRSDEREECAKVCEQYKGYGGNLFAPAIRNRGNT